jgi:hypothetical protein
MAIEFQKEASPLVNLSQAVPISVIRESVCRSAQRWMPGVPGGGLT